MPVYALTMLLAGVGIPILAALNAALGARMASPAAAAVILFCVALSAASAVLLVAGPAALVRAAGVPRHLFLGGLFVAFYVITVTYIAPKFGVGNAVFFVLLGQLASAAVIDHFGLFGARVNPFTLTQGTGVALMAVGVWVTQRV